MWWFLSKKKRLFIPYLTVTKKEGNSPKTPIGIRLTSLDSITYTPSHKLCCFPDFLQLKNYCAEPHNATSDHTNGPSKPHVSQHKNYFACGLRLNIYNAPAQPDMTDRHHSTSQSTSCLLFHRKHSNSTSFQTLTII
jgi:hypothetical protein